MADERKAVVLSVDGVQALIGGLGARGYRVVGPTIREGAIFLGDVTSIDDLPRGWGTDQDAGHYRLTRRNDDALFGHTVGPDSWRKFLYPPVQRVWSAQRLGEGVNLVPEPDPQERFAFLGVRACDLHAMAAQDRVFLGGAYSDPCYRARRGNAFVVAVNCGVAGGTCFCASMKTGPKVSGGFDLALTEIATEREHIFLAVAGTSAGETTLAALPHRAATQPDVDRAESIVAATAASMGRQMRSDDVRDLLLRNIDHPQWEDVARRCLSCGNCTMVCPTCFCTSVEDSSDLAGKESSRSRRWDSCFTTDFSYVHGGSVRSSVRSRYRQWMTHKLCTSIDQFGAPGCVGCGRCITWCPVGIDITEEVRAIREQGAP